MSLGLGQLAGMGILSQFFGGGEQQQQQQQQPQQGQNQGFFPDLNNMSQSQWANTAIALNSMRLEPDANLATAMRETIANANKQQGLKKAGAVLRGMISEEYPNGRVDLAEMVESGALDASTAIQMAHKKEPVSAFAEKMEWLKNNPDASDEQKALAGISMPSQSTFAEKMEWLENNPDATVQELQMLGINSSNLSSFAEKMKWMKDNPNATDEMKIAAGVKQPPSAFMEKMTWLGDNPDASADQKAVVGIATNSSTFMEKLDWLADNPDATDGQLQVLGISNPLQYKQQLAELLTDFEAGDITRAQYLEGRYKLLTGLTPPDGKTDKYKFLEMVAEDLGYVKGSKEWQEFFATNSGGQSIHIDLGGGSDAADLYAEKWIPEIIKETVTIQKDVDTALTQIEKLGNLMDILEQDTANDVTPFTGIFQPMLTQASRIVTSLGLDTKFKDEIDAVKANPNSRQAKDILYEKLVRTEITKVMTGSDVFPMISSLGIGARGLDTPAERDFLISVMTGLPTMTIDTLKIMTKFRLKMYLDGLEKYNRKVDSGYFKMHNQNENFVPFERIDTSKMYRYDTQGNKIQTGNTYSQDEVNLIMKYNIK